MGMGCCQSNKPITENESAFSDFTKNQHHTKDSAYTWGSINKAKVHGTTNQYYASRQIKPTHSSNDEKVSSSDSSNNDPTKELIQNKQKHKISSPLPYDKLDKNRLSPNKTNHILQTEEIEFSVSKSRKSQYRKRTEPQSPDNDLINKMNAEIMNDPPPILDELDNASDASSVSSDNVEIPGLKEIVFAEDDDENDENDEDNEDVSLKAIAYLVQQENERIAREIERMQSHISEQKKTKAATQREGRSKVAKKRRGSKA